ncbi:MAG: hypothetical protein IPM82_02465 [Saprospiraceae bacterium]|nr:hypothetical protein [Saprospiraceae bacterium]
MPDMQPPVEEVLLLIEELNNVWHVKTHFGQGGERGKRKLALFKQLQPIILQWGDYMVQLVEAKKVYHFDTGFPSLDMDRLRRPTASATYRVSRNRNPTGLTTMSCRKEPAVLLFFHWQASEDNENWFTLATTRLPKLTTKKLDPNKRYYFRKYMSNPKGNSDIHQNHWHGPQ